MIVEPGRLAWTFPAYGPGYWFEATGKVLLLSGLFLMVSGDGITNGHRPVPAHAWPWLYLVVLAAALASLAAAGRIGWQRAPHLEPLAKPVALLAAAFAVSALFSQVPSLSALALATVGGLIAFGWIVAHIVAHDAWHDRIWNAIAAATLVLSYHVISFRLDQGLDTLVYQVQNNAWLGKLQLAWLFNLVAPFLLARGIGHSRSGVAAFSALAWLASGAATYVLFSRIGSLMFLLTTIAVCASSWHRWRRWAPFVLAAALTGGIMFLGSIEATRQMVSTFLDAERNAGVSFRVSVWQDALRMFQAHPLTGIGLGTFDDVAYRFPGTTVDPHFYRQGWHAHNVYLHLLAETGLLGFAAYGYLWLVILASLTRSWWQASASLRPYTAAALCSVLAFLMLSFTEVLIGARVHASLRMNLVLVFIVVYAMHVSRSAAHAEPTDHTPADSPAQVSAGSGAVERASPQADEHARPGAASPGR